MKEKTLYVCGVDWQHEIDNCASIVKFYNSVERLKEQNKCWKQCGIVKLKVVLKEWVEDQDLHSKIDE